MVRSEVQETWRKSKHCEGGSCVEIQARPGLVMVRDGDNPAGPPLVFTPAGWRSFTEQAKRLAFDPGSFRSGPA
jgi:hypothetical protein